MTILLENDVKQSKVIPELRTQNCTQHNTRIEVYIYFNIPPTVDEIVYVIVNRELCDS